MHTLSIFLGFAVALPIAVVRADVPRTPDLLTQIGEVRSLSLNEAAKARPVHVIGVVTWRGLGGQIIVQDDTGGCWIYVDEARLRKFSVLDDRTLNSIRVGHVLEIEGNSDPGSYAPGIMPRTLRIIGQRALPPAHPMNPARFFSGAEANMRVAVRGVVQGFQPADTGWLLELNANPGHFTAEVTKSALPDPAALVDAEVSVTGVAVTRVNTRGEITMPRVYSSQADELVVEAPATAPFAAPLVPLDRLLPFHPESRGPHRLRVIGTVTYALPGKFLYLQEGTSAVRVEAHFTERFQAGDRVEAAGFVDMARYVGTLVEAQVRKVG
ncbi:MAG: hypothetical protein PSW75_03240, partial [bacterium]|nr:hypothetical protein [bacterium]